MIRCNVSTQMRFIATGIAGHFGSQKSGAKRPPAGTIMPVAGPESAVSPAYGTAGRKVEDMLDAEAPGALGVALEGDAKTPEGNRRSGGVATASKVLLGLVAFSAVAFLALSDAGSAKHAPESKVSSLNVGGRAGSRAPNHKVPLLEKATPIGARQHGWVRSH